MFRSKYSTILTIILILIIIAIVVVATILAVGAYKDFEEEKNRKKVFAELQENIREEDNNEVVENIVDNENIFINTVENNIIQNNTSGEEVTNRPQTHFYKEYPMIGYIKIEKTKIEYPILIDVTPGALEVGVGVMYPSNPKLNEKGNVVIIGHNYRNGKFFADNDKLVIGDKIKITDLKGKTLTYTIYEISVIPETDTEYITRQRGDNIEISLSTCTDDGNARLVILARVE